MTTIPLMWPALASCVLLSAAMVCAPAAAQSLYVATNGNDAWSGKLPERNAAGDDGPLATLARARDILRELRAADPEVALNVTVRGGTYYLDEPLILGIQDSGTVERPVRWQAAEGEAVVLSGGRPITTRWERAEGEIQSTRIPEAAGGAWPFRLLRVGDDWAIRARYPNFDAENPYTGGWLFVKPSSRAEGSFGAAVGNIHNPGDMMEWRVEAPATGDYNVFLYYGALNAPFGRTDMGGRTTMTVDDGEPVVLQDLPDTGGWSAFRWAGRNATLRLEQGTRTIRWTNVHGGGINFDAFVLCDDPDWRPQGAPPAPPPAGRHMIVVHAETFAASRGRELSVTLPASRRHFGFDPAELRRWARPDEIEMHVFPAWGWVSSIEPIAELDMEQGVGTLAGREAHQELRVGNRYYLANIREELDMPGEWYLDRETGELLYWPTEPDFADKEIVAPVHDRIIHILGDPDGPEAGHIELVGFTFMDTSYTPRIENCYYPPDAAIWIEDASGCLIEDCRFTRLGGSALNLVGAAHHNRFLGNVIEHVGQNGVYMDGKAQTFPAHNVIAGCHMRHIGLVYKHVAGVYIGQRDPALAQAPGNVIAHNLITDCPRYGIGIKMNQGNHVVEFNEIRRSNLETNDTGGIESCVRNLEAAGNIYRHNLVVDAIGLLTTQAGEIRTPYYTWGIYLDDYSSNAHVYGNICVRNYRAGVVVHGGRNNVIENNILVDSELQQAEFNNIRGSMVENTFRRNIAVRLRPGGNMIRSGGWTDEVLAECDHNLYWHAGAEPPEITFLGRSLDDWRGMGYDHNSIIADPLFVDPENDDYRLRPESPAFALGFEPIPVERIGLAGYERGRY